MKRQLKESSIEFERLRNEMSAMVRQLDMKDERLRQYERRLNESPPRIVAPAPSMPSELENMLRHEADALVHENRMLKEKLNTMSIDMERLMRSKPMGDPQTEGELRRLRVELSDKQREVERLSAQVRES
jgi:hypothetical protein